MELLATEKALREACTNGYVSVSGAPTEAYKSVGVHTIIIEYRTADELFFPEDETPVDGFVIEDLDGDVLSYTDVMNEIKYRFTGELNVVAHKK